MRERKASCLLRSARSRHSNVHVWCGTLFESVFVYMYVTVCCLFENAASGARTWD